MKSIIFAVTFLITIPVMAGEKVVLSCETSKQEVHSIDLEVYNLDKKLDEVVIIKKEFGKYNDEPSVTRHDSDSISSIKKYVSIGSGQFGANETIVLIVLINEKELSPRKAVEHYICYGK